MAVIRPELPELNSGYKYGWSDPEAVSMNVARKGLSAEVVEEISRFKGEPEWMTKVRLKAYRHFEARPMPNWGADLSGIDFQDIYYYIAPTDKAVQSWDDVPDYIRRTYDKLGIPEAEKKFLAGVGGQYDSEVVYHNLREDLEKQGVIFMGTDQALKEHPELFREYFGTVIPANDNKLAALNTAVWSGGSFIYVPKGVHIELPLQAYFRINTQNMGQFERTLIIADEGSSVHYLEGCTAPTYSTVSLHSAVVEIIVKKGARVRYSTIQNWSHNVYNLVTKRAVAHEDAIMEWVDGNLGCLREGSRVTTPRGIKPIQDVEVGDQVLSYDEGKRALCFQKVTGKTFSGMQLVRSVEAGNRRLWATDNHPFYSYRYYPERAKKSRRYELDYVRADELSEAIIPCASIDYGQPYRLTRPAAFITTAYVTKNQHANNLAASRTRENNLRLPEFTNDSLMWLFGLFTGDGNIQRKQAQHGGSRWAKVGFSVPQNDRAREKLMELMGEINAPKPTERSDGVYLCWNSVALADFFEQNGFTTGAHEKSIPAWVADLPESQRLAFIAGYLDSDGCVIASSRIFQLKSCNRKLLEQASELLIGLGISSRLHAEFSTRRELIIRGYQTFSNGSYALVFKLDPRLFDYLTPGLSEKARSSPRPSKIYKRTVGGSTLELPEFLEINKVKIGRPLEELQPTWDIEVAGTGNFISEGFIVHNSKITMKYPSIYLVGERAHGEVLSVALAGDDQHQDAGGKIIHAAPNTTSIITSKSVSRGSGRTSYRGLIKVYPGCEGAKSAVRCDALILNENARSDTYPYMEIDEEQVTIGHEASVSKVGGEQLFYLMSRGLSEAEATAMIVNGFIEPIVKELPMEYAVELNRLIQMSMEGSVG